MFVIQQLRKQDLGTEADGFLLENVYHEDIFADLWHSASTLSGFTY